MQLLPVIFPRGVAIKISEGLDFAEFFIEFDPIFLQFGFLAVKNLR